jgi:hypothetical protein
VDRWSAFNEPDGESASLRRKVAWAVVRLLDTVPSVMFTRNESRWNDTTLLADIQLVRWIRAQQDGVLVGTRPGINLALARWAGPGPVVVVQDHLNTTVYRKALKKEFRPLLPEGRRRRQPHRDRRRGVRGDRRAQDPRPGDPERCPDVHGCAATAKPDNDSKLVVAGARLTGRRASTAARRLGVGRQETPRLAAGDLCQRRPDRPEGEGSRPRDRRLGAVHGAYLELPEIMSQASIFVLTSRFEGFPMVLLEAMTIGLPVVSYDCPTGPSELIVDGRNGYLVPNGDAETFAERLSDLMQDPGKAPLLRSRRNRDHWSVRDAGSGRALGAAVHRAGGRSPSRRASSAHDGWVGGSKGDRCARLAPRQTLTRLFQGLTAIRPVDARSKRSRSRVASKNSSTA